MAMKLECCARLTYLQKYIFNLIFFYSFEKRGGNIMVWGNVVTQRQKSRDQSVGLLKRRQVFFAGAAVCDLTYFLPVDFSSEPSPASSDDGAQIFSTI